MSYEEAGNEAEVRLEGGDRDRAQKYAADAAKAIQELGLLVARVLGREDSLEPGQRTIGVQMQLAADIGVSTFCDWTTGDCLYVYDAFAGVCRPCGPGDSGCTPHPHVSPDELLPE